MMSSATRSASAAIQQSSVRHFATLMGIQIKALHIFLTARLTAQSGRLGRAARRTAPGHSTNSAVGLTSMAIGPLSGHTSMTRMAQAQLSGQLYCIRAPIARQILLPRDLAACEDGFIKALVCTDFLTGNICPDRVVQARGAAHVFQSYRTISDVLRNQKRQMIGQTIVHILIDKYLKELPVCDRLNIAATLRARECSDRDWLKRLIAQHLREIRFFWRLFPNLLRFRFERWRALPLGKRISHLPSALTGYAVTLVASRMAFRFLKQGSINYWPDTRSPGLKDFVPDRASEPFITTAIQP